MNPPPLPTVAEPTRMNWFDQQFSEIGWPMLIALTILFCVLMWVFSGIGWMMARHPVARFRAKVIFIVSSCYLAACAVGLTILVRHPEYLRP